MLLLDGQDVLNPEENGLLQDEPRIDVGETGAKPDGIRSEPITFHRR